ncbi:hypothetical protein [Herbaspirillum sp.]|uniref:hypothetical protein n=1 Tax=Herbaspirillum sp. TaxID=1890675 RepID=UPI001B049724|nr:hypothetical protein [Herbaspirillum sp.]MBO9536688.1 hypothetical protein [Herbaspirillum sp.]
MDASDALARTSARDMPDFSDCADKVTGWVMTKMAAARRSCCALATRRKRYGNSIGASPSQRGSIALIRIGIRPRAAFRQHFILSSGKIHPRTAELGIVHKFLCKNTALLIFLHHS